MGHELPELLRVAREVLEACDCDKACHRCLLTFDTQFDIERLWIKNITVTTGLVDTRTIPTLMRLIEAGKLDTRRMATHRFALHDAMKAYDTFANAAKEQAIKVVMRA